MYTEERLKMGTTIRTSISESSTYYISKDRYLELKHFCLQYKDWLDLSNKLTSDAYGTGHSFDGMPHGDDISNPTEKIAIAKSQYTKNMQMVEDAAKEAGGPISEFIFMAVTKDLAYPCLRTMYDIPCGKNYYYERYRKFFWILSQMRG